MALSQSIDQLRLTLALAAARATSSVIRRSGRGGGTAAPGLVAVAIDPGLIGKLAAQLQGGVIVVAGTNGKTTTCRMIAGVLEADGQRVMHNRSGSNLVRGVAATFATQTTVLGRPKADIAVIESDEAALPEILRAVQPRYLLLTNLFRDQLDRYGELRAVSNLWRHSFITLDRSTTVLVNADDPTLVEITENLPCRRLLYGLDAPEFGLDALPHAADASNCPRCGADFSYHSLYLAHLGDWFCPVCGLARPPLEFSGGEILLHGMESLSVQVTHAQAAPTIRVDVPGLYNVYNTVAAVALTATSGVSMEIVTLGLGSYRPAFGRIERVTFRDRRLTLVLAKNPVGYNEVLRTFTVGGDLLAPTLIAINDLAADGRDVSWLWDVDFELLASGSLPISTSGLRSADMANRLRYAGVEDVRITDLSDDLRSALFEFTESIPAGGEGYLLLTYTALLAVRESLASEGVVESFWKQ